MSGSIDLPVISKFDPTGIKQAQKAVQGFGKGLRTLGGLVAGAFAVSALSNFVKEAIQGAEVAEQYNNRIRAVAKATQVFGDRTDDVTDSLIKFADSQEMVIGQEAEIIKGVQAQLLSFKKLSTSAGEVGGVFDRVTMAAFDMAAAGFGSAESNAIALGKAFEDPIRGLTALRRSGTVFTEEQQELIKTLVESGDVLGAQEIILQELETQYGGTAEATALWSDRLRLSFDAVKDAVGEALTPAFEAFAQYFITEVQPKLLKFFQKDFPVLIQKAGEVVEALKPAFAGVGEVLREALDIEEGTSLLTGLLDKIAEFGSDPEFMDFLKDIAESFILMLPALVELVPLMLELAEQAVPLLVEILPDLTAILVPLIGFFGDLVEGVASFFGWMTETADNLPEWAKGFEILFDPLEELTEFWRVLTQAIQLAITKIREFLKLQDRTESAGAFRGSNPSGGGGRAEGGMVTGGTMYAVGERGPELFIPNTNGVIVPNKALGGSSINIVVNAGMGANGSEIGREIVSAIRRYERTSGKVFASA